MNDAELWDLVLSGDMAALSQLYKAHYSLLFNWGMKFVADEEFVKDCIQDVFVKICSSRQLSPTPYVRSYFMTSLRNMIFDKVSASHATVSISERLFEIDDDDPGIEMIFQDDDDARRKSRQLIRAYNSLTKNQRISIYLRYVRGLSYKEIAAVMEMNPQSAMNLVSRALKSMRTEMGPVPFAIFLCLFLS